ncbi:hypothetical protein BGX28_000756 [Mortierella sp. GBA30]|nr:hypothetical protein BGX28_000756 [Mortierella sp. GBA30]
MPIHNESSDDEFIVKHDDHAIERSIAIYQSDTEDDKTTVWTSSTRALPFSDTQSPSSLPFQDAQIPLKNNFRQSSAEMDDYDVHDLSDAEADNSHIYITRRTRRSQRGSNNNVLPPRLTAARPQNQQQQWQLPHFQQLQWSLNPLYQPSSYPAGSYPLNQYLPQNWSSNRTLFTPPASQPYSSSTMDMHWGQSMLSDISIGPPQHAAPPLTRRGTGTELAPPPRTGRSKKPSDHRVQSTVDPQSKNHKWTEAEEDYILDWWIDGNNYNIYKTPKKFMMRGTLLSKQKLQEIIAGKLLEKFSIKVSPQQVKNKMDALRNKYHKARALNKKDNLDNMDEESLDDLRVQKCRYYLRIHNVFQKDFTQVPMNVVEGGIISDDDPTGTASASSVARQISLEEVGELDQGDSDRDQVDATITGVGPAILLDNLKATCKNASPKQTSDQPRLKDFMEGASHLGSLNQAQAIAAEQTKQQQSRDGVTKMQIEHQEYLARHANLERQNAHAIRMAEIEVHRQALRVKELELRIQIQESYEQATKADDQKGRDMADRRERSQKSVS